MGKQIKIKESVHEQLNAMKHDEDTFSRVIERVIDENKALKDKNEDLQLRCDELKEDKEIFVKLNSLKNISVKHKAIIEKDDIDLLINEGVNEFLRQHYKSYPEGNYDSTPLELIGLASIVNALYEIDIEHDNDNEIDKSKLFELIGNINEVRIAGFKGQDYDDFDVDDTFYQILNCNVRDYNVKDDLLTYLKE